MDVSDFLLYSTSFVSLFVSIFWFTVYFSADKKRTLTAKLRPMTMIVPVYNEEKTIRACIQSLLKQGYPGLKIIIVDDGSTDSSGRIVKELAKKHRNVKYFRKKNGGKSSALNHGLRRVKTELFGFIDSDTYLASGALRNMVGYFHDNVASVTICIKPASTTNLVQKLQRVEYMVASFTRKLLSYIHSVYYTPGFALYKTDVVKKLGGFDESTLSEDLEIGLRLKSAGYDIENTVEKYAYTEVPGTFKELFNQRMRWYRGYIELTRRYKHMFLNKNFGDLGLMVLPIQYILLALITPFMLYSIYDSLANVIKRLIDVYLVGFDVSYFYNTSVFNFITPTTFFFVAVLAAFFFMLKLSQSNVDEKIGKGTYIAYIVLYPFINTLLWIAAFIYEVLNVKKKW